MAIFVQSKVILSMKKILAFAVLALMMAAGCTEKNEMKVLVSYFSATGNTKAAAEKLAAVMGADLYEIAPEVKYTEADLDWRDTLSRSTLEMKDLSSRPALAEPKTDVSGYDVIFVGFPIWWYTAPTIINTYLESGDFTGKTVIAFATSGSSSIDKACADLAEAYPSFIWKDGKRLNDVTEEELAAWKEELGL